jgi:hypothetical protein
MEKAIKNDILKLNELKEKINDQENNENDLFNHLKSLKPFQRPFKQISASKSIFDKQTKIDDYSIIKTYYATCERYSSLIDLKNLNEIYLKDLFINKIHFGEYIQLKTIDTSGIHMIVQDNNNDTENLIMIDMMMNHNNNNDPTIPIGTKFIVKEPHLQLFSLENEFSIIRIDSPSNLIIKSYPEDIDDLLTQAEDCCCQLNKANRLYTQIIEKSNKTNFKAYLNRCQINLKLEKYYSAYQDGLKAVDLDKNNEMAHFYLAKSAYMISKYEEALKSFEICLKLSNENNSQAKYEIELTKERINESTNGIYNFQKLYEQFFKKDNLYMDIADFKSSRIKVTDIENKCKGVIAIDFIPKNALLVVNKAVTASLHNKIDYICKSYNFYDLHDNVYSTRNECENISNLVYKMQDNPELAEKIYSLYAGPNFDRNKMLDHPLIDIKRIESIYTFNSFQIKNSYEALELVELEKEIETFKLENNELDEQNDYDFKNLEFGLVNFDSELYENFKCLQIKYDNLDKQSGLWYYSAFFNHSCLSNCTVRTIGDVQIFYASKDIQKNEEITISI